MFKMTYDKETNAFYFEFNKKDIDQTLDLNELTDVKVNESEVMIDIDKEGNIVGIEVLI